MKRKVSELDGAMLDVAVALALGAKKHDWRFDPCTRGGLLVCRTCDVSLCCPPWSGAKADKEYPLCGEDGTYARPAYSTSWQHAGPIIDRELIATFYEKGGYPAPCWVAGYDLGIDSGGSGHGNSEMTGPDAPTLELTHAQSGPTRLIAALRSFVASKLGDDVELPEIT